MKQTVTMMLPVSPNDLAGVQAWLQGMAAQGLVLDYYGSLGFVFNKTDPACLRYRIDPRKGHFISGPPQSLQDMYAEYGWTYVDTYNGTFHIFVTDDLDAVEPFSTTESLMIALDYTMKKQLVLFAVSMLFYVFQLWFWLSRGRFDFQAIFCIMLVVTGLPTQIYHIRTLLAQNRQLKGGIPLGSPLVAETHPTLYWGRRVVFLMLVVFVVYHVIR